MLISCKIRKIFLLMLFNLSNNVLPASFCIYYYLHTNCNSILLFKERAFFTWTWRESSISWRSKKTYFHKKHSNVRKLQHHQSLLERLNVVFPLPDADVHFLTSNIEKYDDRCTNCVESAFITLPDLLSIQYLLCTYIIM